LRSAPSFKNNSACAIACFPPFVCVSIGAPVSRCALTTDLKIFCWCGVMLSSPVASFINPALCAVRFTIGQP